MFPFSIPLLVQLQIETCVKNYFGIAACAQSSFLTLKDKHNL